MSAPPRCSFYLRAPVGDLYRYELISVRGPDGLHLVTAYPPLVGDLISLAREDSSGTFRVIERRWHHSSWGSIDWPYIAKEPTSGPMLDIIVINADGPYRDEAPLPEGWEDE